MFTPLPGSPKFHECPVIACPSGVEAVLLNCTIPVAGKQPAGMVKLVVGGAYTVTTFVIVSPRHEAPSPAVCFILKAP